MTRVTELPFTGASTNTSYNPGFLVVENQLTRRLPWNSLVDYFRRNVYGADQSVATTSSVAFQSLLATTATFTNLTVYDWVSIGSTLLPGQTTAPAPLYISNVLGSARTRFYIRGYRENYTTPSAFGSYPTITGEYSRGTYGAPASILQGDVLLQVVAGGYDGNKFTSQRDRSSAALLFFAEEDWKTDIGLDVSTASGTSLLLRTQPVATRSGISDPSTQITMAQTWLIDQTHNIPIAAWSFGSGLLGENPTLTRADGTTYQGHGASLTTFLNSKVLIMGVPREHLVGVENPTLSDTNSLQFVGHRRSAVLTRRDIIQKDDTLGRIEFRGQHISSATSGQIGLIGGEISYKALETFQVGTGSGTKIVLTSINSGTNLESTRLELLNKEHTHFSDRHSFRAADGTLLAQLTTASFAVFVTSTIQASGLSLRQTFTATTSLMSTGTFTTINLLGYKSYMIQKVETNLPARVRFYTDDFSRNNDKFRSEGISATSYNGVIADIITTTTGLVRTISPGILGFNNDTSTNSTVYMTVNNKHTTTATITVSLTVLQLES